MITEECIIKNYYEECIMLNKAYFNIEKINNKYWCTKLINYSNKDLEVSVPDIASCIKSGIFSNIELDSIKIVSNSRNIVYIKGIFKDSLAKEIDLSKFDCSMVKTFESMFNGCVNLISINFGNIETSNVESMAKMFKNCKRIESIDLSMLNTSNVVDMRKMFMGCSRINNLILKRFNTKNLIDAELMFEGCIRIINLDLGSFSADNLVYTSRMFLYCYRMSYLNIDKIRISSIRYKDEMFNGCLRLDTINCSLDDEYCINELMKDIETA